MTRVIPPIVHVDRTPKGRLLAFFADGRVAGRSTEPDAEWVAIDHIDYNALWPEDAPVADAKPTVRWLNRSTWWCDDCQAAHGAEIPICFCGTRRPTPTP